MPQDDAEAVKLLKKTAEQGNLLAQKELVSMYANGEGVPQDDAESVRWTRKAAEQGNADAQHNLGSAYYFGKGVTKDLVEAVKWYRKAAEQENAEAQWRLGLGYGIGHGVAKDPVEAVKWFRMAAEQGNSNAQSVLGSAYNFGKGVTKDLVEAVKWYRKAAEQGDADAQFNLGVCYGKGQGVTKDLVEAVKWYRKAAEQGNAEAQIIIGQLYRDGDGVTKDLVEAAKWARKAAEQGNADGQLIIGILYSSGQGVAKDPMEAAKWYRKAAEQGNARGQSSLAFCYALGNGVVENEIEAYKWLLLAAAQGDENSRKGAEMIGADITATQRAEGQRLAQVWEAQKEERNAATDAKSFAPSRKDDAEPKVTGTGFFITRSGYLVTNHHVVKGASKVRVETAVGMLDAVVLRVDETSDLALLKVAGNFDALPVVSSRKTHLGATVATVGFPNVSLQGFAPKLSKGEISSLSGVQDDVKQFQISVPVQPGNSGGALVDERGNVVGVVVAMLNQKVALESSGALPQNVNYAVKSSYLLGFLEAVPAVSGGMIDERTDELNFEAVVEDVKKAAVLVIGY